MDAQELIRLAKDGDEAAFDELVRQTLSGTYRFVRSLGASEADAEDAVQQAYIRAWKALSKLDETRPITPWLYQIAKRAFFDLIRNKKPLSFSEVSEDEKAFSGTLADPEPLPDKLFEREEGRLRVRAALTSLSTREQTILTLRYDESFSFEEVAQTLELPAATVRSIHHRALAKLREVLGDAYS